MAPNDQPHGTALNIQVLYSRSPRSVMEIALHLSPGASLRDALVQTGWLENCPELRLEQLCVGIWGRKSTLDTPLREGDRVEIYRPLRVDPKVARRERFVGQGARAAGLFAQRRPGSKAGY